VDKDIYTVFWHISNHKVKQSPTVADLFGRCASLLFLVISLLIMTLKLSRCMSSTTTMAIA